MSDKEVKEEKLTNIDKKRIEQAEKEYANGELIPAESVREKFFGDKENTALKKELKRVGNVNKTMVEVLEKIINCILHFNIMQALDIAKTALDKVKN